MSTHKDWFSRTTKGDSINSAAKLAGIPQASLNKRLQKGILTMEDITLISRAYALNPIEELARVDYLLQSEIDRVQNASALTEASDEDIAAEVWRRLVNGEAEGPLTEPLTGPRGPSHLSVVPDNLAASKNDGTHNEFEGRD
jgi:hypothetical protein